MTYMLFAFFFYLELIQLGAPTPLEKCISFAQHSAEEKAICHVVAAKVSFGLAFS